MKNKKYIHYGHTSFDPNIFTAIQNDQYWSKPIGGLWASPVNAKLGWKDWCEREGFAECIEQNSFKFTLPNANILTIDSVKHLAYIPSLGCTYIGVLIDFEKCIKLGYDAIELCISADYRLCRKLYSWDCDSIIVMNPDKIKMVK